MTDIRLLLNGQEVWAKPGETIIQVADRHGVYIPRFCYHKDLSIAANCRMCLVEVENVPKTLPACATPVSPDMSVRTQSALTQKAQKAIMSFLLINHPLDCPICDQGGECDLQDLAMTYGNSEGFAPVDKRAVADEDLGPLVQTHMTRCIQCTRCVRFGKEIAGYQELGQLGRSNDVSIGTSLKSGMSSPLSGNVIELCPVGALTDKTYRFQGRSWGYKRHPSIAPHDCVGSHTYIHHNPASSRENQLMRIVPRHARGLNHIWLSDRDRFSYTAYMHERLTTPMVKTHGMWQEVSWQEALTRVSEKCHQLQQKNANMAWLSGPQTTTEEALLMQHLARSMGWSDIDSRLRLGDNRDQEYFISPMGAMGSFESLTEYTDIMIVGGHIAMDQPVMHVALRAAASQVKVHTVRATDQAMQLPLATDFVSHPGLWLQFLKDWCGGVQSEAKVLWIMCVDVFYHEQGSEIRQAVFEHATKREDDCWVLTDGPNTAGQVWAGMVPYQGPAGIAISRRGRSFHEIAHHGADAFWLHGIEPTKDTLYPQEFYNKLKAAQWICAVHPFVDEGLMQVADVILPSVPSTETFGTFVNMFGMFQSFMPAQSPLAQSKPAADIYQTLLECVGFERLDVKAMNEKMKNTYRAGHTHTETIPIRSSETYATLNRWSMVDVNAVVRRSSALQKAWPRFVMKHVTWLGGE